MTILLVFYFIFLVIYLIFNIYAILRVWSIRLEGDNTQIVIILYMAVVSGLILISLMMLPGLNWSDKIKFKL